MRDILVSALFQHIIMSQRPIYTRNIFLNMHEI